MFLSLNTHKCHSGFKKILFIFIYLIYYFEGGGGGGGDILEITSFGVKSTFKIASDTCS